MEEFSSQPLPEEERNPVGKKSPNDAEPAPPPVQQVSGLSYPQRSSPNLQGRASASTSKTVKAPLKNGTSSLLGVGPAGSPNFPQAGVRRFGAHLSPEGRLIIGLAGVILLTSLVALLRWFFGVLDPEGFSGLPPVSETSHSGESASSGSVSSVPPMVPWEIKQDASRPEKADTEAAAFQGQSPARLAASPSREASSLTVSSPVPASGPPLSEKPRWPSGADNSGEIVGEKGAPDLSSNEPMVGRELAGAASEPSFRGAGMRPSSNPGSLRAENRTFSPPPDPFSPASESTPLPQTSPSLQQNEAIGLPRNPASDGSFSASPQGGWETANTDSAPRPLAFPESPRSLTEGAVSSPLASEPKPNREGPTSVVGHASARLPQDTTSPARNIMTYQTKGGESVFELATRFLGNPSRWFQIVELNEEYLTDVHLLEALPPGLVLKIPAPARWESSATPNSASFAQ